MINNKIWRSWFMLALAMLSFLPNPYASDTDPLSLFWADLFTAPTLDTLPPLRERYGDFINDEIKNPYDLKDPKVVKKSVEYDPSTGLYKVTEKIGGSYFRPPTYMTFDEYMDWRAKKENEAYILELGQLDTKGSNTKPLEPYEENVRTGLADRLFCGTNVDIRPQGNLDLTFGVDFQRIDNPILAEQQRRQGGFDFDMNIQMNVIGKIGQKLQLSLQYNTQAAFNFDNQVKLEYKQDTECSEDDIVRKVEAGNVSLPLRTSLINGSQNLFGFKTQLQFGRLTTTLLVSQSQSQRQELQIQGGAQVRKFEVSADQYDENRHFFMSHYNRNTYEQNLQQLPQINTQFAITKLEVWITNDRNVTEGVRDVVAFADLGETNPDNLLEPNRLAGATEQGRDLRNNRLPDNDANTLYQELLASPNARDLDRVVSTLQSGFNMQDSRDFSKIRARKLAQSEYTFHPQLGFLSLNVSVKPTDVVGVAYQYTYNGKTYQVGEFAQDLPISADTLNVMYLKMLKSTRARVDLPIWDLMMKNVYSLGAFQINSEDFRLDVLYQDPGGGEKRFLPSGPQEGVPLIQLLNLDNLNRNLDPTPDGQFDFVPGLTINPNNGRIIFPVLEPFGSSLGQQLSSDPASEAQFVYNQLYDSTITIAREYPEYNRYIIRGQYKSSVSSEIALGGFNIPQGSVTVTAGGAILTEGQDYSIDYNLGRIKILNEAIMNSGQAIRVSYEDNSAFGFQRKTLLGTRFDYFINDNFNIGGTFMRLSERPFTQKVNYGDDPIANSIYGIDVQYSNEAPWLTRALDKLPLYSTKAQSNIAITAEGALLDPGSPKVIDQGQNAGGIVYIDDFEGSSSNFNLKIPAINWHLASTPRNPNNPLFPEASLTNDYAYNKNRARIAWYQLDPILTNSSRSTNAPGGINATDQRSVYAQQILQQDVFPNVQVQFNQNSYLPTFDLAYYPTERGPYNYDTDNIDPATGAFTNPQNRWGGVMRSLQNNDFEASNIEFIEVWVLSPFKEGYGGNGGKLYIDLGDVSEDVLKDSRNFFENGLPEPAANIRTDTTRWSRVPRVQAVTNAFDNDPAIRAIQDIGLDGFDDAGERFVLDSFLNIMRRQLGANNPAFQALEADPASDNFRYYRDDFYEDNPPTQTVLGRYKQFNNPQGNSPASDGSSAFISAATNQPDAEDINRDNTLNEEESYFQYEIPIQPEGAGQMQFTQYTTDSITMQYEGPNGSDEATWYQLRIPIDQFTDRVGGIQDFRSIRFMRMYMTGFEEETILRFARLDLVRNQWRRYRRDLFQAGVALPPDDLSGTEFDVAAVNIERNGQRFPFPYVLPPGVQREQTVGSINNALQNEQSLSMSVCGLQDGDARAVYKNINLDMRVYKRLQMFVHAESVPERAIENDQGDLTLFLRLGSDFERNYYEYEIPLTMSSEIGTEIPEDIWLDDNYIDLQLDNLYQLKIARQNAQASEAEIYEEPDPDDNGKMLRVIGNPSLGQVESIMIGVRNSEDDGLSRCAEVWVNELRLSGFDERGGTAALVRMDAQLADLGSMTFAGSFKSIGFGSIDQQVNERSRERVIQYDVSGTINLDKFFPKKWGLRLPMYAQYGAEVRTPEFDPYQLDVPLRTLLDGLQDRGLRDSIRRQAETFKNISSINFTNVRKERTNASRLPMPWDIENFSFTYAHTRQFQRDPLIQNELRTENRGAINYQYTRPVAYIEPFKKLIKKGKYLQLIKDFNFNPFPNTIGFRNEAIRRYAETTYRFSGPSESTWYDKLFTWDRTYNVQWDLTRSLKLNFTANNRSLIDEPEGQIDTQEERDSIWTNVRQFGRNTNYRHNASVNYQVPFNKIPILDWVSASARYNTDYSWTAASLRLDSLGNVLTNSQSRQVNAKLDFLRLYNKVKYLKKINTPKRRTPKKNNQNLPVRPENSGAPGKKDKKDKPREPSVIERILIRPIMMLRSVQGTYSEDFTTVLPGFMPQSKYLGQGNNGLTEPGLDFAFGYQPDRQWLDAAAQKGWMTTNIFLSQQFTQTRQENYSISAVLEPFKDFRIDVDVNRNVTENYSELFKIDTIGGSFSHLTPMNMGSVTLSYLPIRTMFDQQGTSGRNSSATFEKFEENRLIISQRIGSGQHADQETNPGYTEGYGRYQQDVLIPAFLAAYTGQDAASYKLRDIRNLFPMPNWRISYNGLSKLPFFSKFLENVNLTHGYKSSLTVNSFATDLDFQEDPTQVDQNSSNYYSTFEIPNIVISEQFAPLIGLDIRLKNDLSMRFNFKKSRQLSMSFNDYQLSETRTQEITVGAGYLFKNFRLFGGKKNNGAKPSAPAQSGGFINFGNTQPKNELNFKLDISIRDDKTVNHILDQDNSVATRGSRTIRIAPSFDYAVNTRLTLRLFYDFNRTIPATSAAYPITNTKGGLTIRFILAQ